MLNWIRKPRLQWVLGVVTGLSLILSGCSQSQDSAQSPENITSPQQMVGQPPGTPTPDGLWYGEEVEDKSLLTDKELEDIAIVTRYNAEGRSNKYRGMEYMNGNNSHPFLWDMGAYGDGELPDYSTLLRVTGVVTNDNTRVELCEVVETSGGEYVLGKTIGDSVLNRWESFSYYTYQTEGEPFHALRVTSEKGKELVVPAYNYDADGSHTVAGETLYMYPYDKNKTQYTDRGFELPDNVLTIAWEKEKQANGAYVETIDYYAGGESGPTTYQVSVDLDQDGEKEDLRFEMGTYNADGSVVPGRVILNGEAVSFDNQLPTETVIDGKAYKYMFIGFDVIDIHPFDQSKELVLFQTAPGPDQRVQYLHYHMGTWTYLGETKGDVSNSFLGYGTINQEKSQLNVSLTTDYFAEFSYFMTYELENEKIVPVTSLEEFQVGYSREEPVTATTIGNLNLYQDPQGNVLSQVVSPGMGVRLLTSDLATWVKVRLDSGQTGYIIYNVQGQDGYGGDYYGLKDQEGLQPYEVLEGLPYYPGY